MKNEIKIEWVDNGRKKKFQMEFWNLYLRALLIILTAFGGLFLTVYLMQI